MHGLILVEGETEEVFYRLLKQLVKNDARASIKGMKGNFNINTKILSYCEQMGKAHKNLQFKVMICIDRESRWGQAPINMEYVKEELDKLSNFDSNRTYLFEAVQDLESWFFHDIKGIYTYLRTPKTNRQNSYSPVEKYNHTDLSKLFKANNKEYKKGERSESFQKVLDISHIINSSPVLQNFCTQLKSL